MVYVIVFVPFLMLIVWIFIATRNCPASCPECQYPMSRFQSPFTKTRRQWLNGGFQCARCHCEIDLSGRVLEREKPEQYISPIIVGIITFVLLGGTLVLPLVMIGILLRR